MLNDVEMDTCLDAQSAPRVTPDRVFSVIKDIVFVHPIGTLTICVLTLANGFAVTGESACVSPENYNEAVGKDIAFSNAKAKIWALEGYAMRERLMLNQG